MPKRLLHEREVDVAGDEVRRQAVFEAVGMPLFGWEAGGLGN